ncbi:olfactory receptor 11A1-like [Mauremys reevesii]|uniref:olfactory receptor 11A1-like n=1 Tax=Mauremys reevesii TaxID=260615 RepID=UPI00193F21DB|nr:olfactory receptor 11A1-like [Mauremys reevesii]
MVNTKWRNQTSITEFILLGFGSLQELQTPLFLLFLMIYIVTMAGNILIIALIVTDQNLHTPMYFFLGNLSCLETCYTSTILPRMLAGLLTRDRTISIAGCFVQYYFFGCLAGSECYLLAAMSYDRYLAICKPLHYTMMMNGRFCLLLITVSWIICFVINSIIIFLLSHLIFCGPNEIDHFFCDLTPLINVSCSDTERIELLAFILSSLIALGPFLLTLTSYMCIIATIVRIPSASRRHKAFSTCSSHLIVVTIFYGTLILVYLLPKTHTLRDLNKLFSLFYTVLTPLANPLIYSLRNKEVSKALSKGVREFTDFFGRQTLHYCFRLK